MTCPYAKEMRDNKNNNNNDIDVNDKESISTTILNDDDAHSVVTNKEKKDKNEEEPLNYTTYLRTEPLLNALKCLSHVDPSDENTEPVHDEHFFILLHQVYELWFKTALFEIDSIRKIFIHSDNSDNIMHSLFNINSRLNRCVKIWKILTEQLELLETMTPIQFLEFRNYITPASGFQSLQFRMIEMKLGLTDKSRKSYKKNYFIHTMFKNEQADHLEKTTNESSLLILVESWLEKVYDSMSFNFLDVFTKDVDRFIKYEIEQKIQNGLDAETAEKASETMKRQFQTMLNEDEYKELLEKNERRISHKAMLAALMITLYHQQPYFQQIYEMLYLLMDVDVVISNWRYRHILLVERQIGRKPGTGGTGGFSYLTETVNEKYQVFVDLFNVSSYLIPQRFLSSLSDELVTSQTISASRSLSSVDLLPYKELPTPQRSLPSKLKQNPSVEVPIQLNNNYLILFLLCIIIFMMIPITFRLFLW